MTQFLGKKFLLPFCFLITSLSFGQLVSTEAQLQNAINNATAGTTITLANGVWSNLDISINKNGTEANPITITAQSPGQVFIEGNSTVRMAGSYIIFEGFVFQNASNLVSNNNRIDALLKFRINSSTFCNNCTVRNIKIDSYNGSASQLEDSFKWIEVFGQFNEVSHSSFIGKLGVGSIIADNRSNGNVNHTRIHHNYFAERTAVGVVNDLNDQDAIRIGSSSTSLSDSFTEVYDNLFYDWSGEIEIISNKSGNNKYYNNTFRDYQGTLTLRHGDNCEVYNNFFFANNNLLSGGIRVIGENHQIYNNYIEGINSEKPDGSITRTAGAINISNGRPNSELSGYFPVINATIVNNTFVNCDFGLRMGTNVAGDLTIPPDDIVFANNIMINTSEEGVNILTTPTGSTVYEGNINQNGDWDLTNGSNGNQTVNSGLLVNGPDFYTIPSGSAAIDAALGSYDFLSYDILGGARDTSPDAGAQEFGATGTNLPYVVADVGESIGFLSAPTSFLIASTDVLGFPATGGSISFDISSNTNWVITDNASWLTVNPASGSSDGTSTATATENTTGNGRSATITLTENGGDLSFSINVTQSNGDFDPNDAVVITDISVTGEGTQEPNIPENTLDGDFETRWSANAEDGSVFLTYNLGCPRIVTSVDIYFHQGDQRIAFFQIATSEDGVNFQNSTDVIQSSGNTVGFETFPLTPNPTAQFVRILGFGNSTGSGWNSYEEVEIYGDSNCASLSAEEVTPQSFNVYPIPSIDGFITIQATQQAIGEVEVFDTKGNVILQKTINDLNGQINLSKLASGIYLLKTKFGTKQIIVK